VDYGGIPSFAACILKIPLCGIAGCGKFCNFPLVLMLVMAPGQLVEGIPGTAITLYY
jgi:hypothetical protein